MNEKSKVAIKDSEHNIIVIQFFPGHSRLRAITITIIVMTDRVSLDHPACNSENPTLLFPYIPGLSSFFHSFWGSPGYGYLTDTCKTHLSAII